MKHTFNYFLGLLMTGALLMTACEKPEQPQTPTDKPGDKPAEDTPATGWHTCQGGDLSMITAYEEAKTPYYDKDGKKIEDLVVWLHETCHWNAARVRLFVNPVITNADGTKQGEIQDLSYATKLGKRIKDAGMSFQLDFHYSDTWADPTKQTIPSAWQNCTKEQLVDSVYAYTKRCLTACVAAGATPDFVQVGNEISYGMLWKSKGADMVSPNSSYDAYAANWEQLSRYLNAGAKAVREVCPETKIIIHIERTKSASQCLNFFDFIGKNNVDYDIIGLSYYPFWHGNLATLTTTMKTLETNFPDKPVQIVETAYYNNYYPKGQSGFDDMTNLWPGTEAGQKKFLEELTATLDKCGNAAGLYYWFPEENGNGGASWNANNIVITNWVNRGLFNPTTHKALEGLYVIGK